MRRIAIFAVCVAFVLSTASSAFAANSTCQSYNPELCQVQNNSATTSTSSASTLPFTGIDVVMLAAGGGLLLGAGLIVRRMSRDAGDPR